MPLNQFLEEELHHCYRNLCTSCYQLGVETLFTRLFKEAVMVRFYESIVMEKVLAVIGFSAG
jgi:hypothetical protein